MHMKNWQALSVVCLACINFVTRQLYIVPFCLRETLGMPFSLVKSSRNAWRGPASVKATRWWRVFWEQRTLNFTWLYRSSVTTDSTCQTGEHCMEQEATSAKPVLTYWTNLWCHFLLSCRPVLAGTCSAERWTDCYKEIMWFP